MTCGNTQGPFARYRVGEGNRSRYIFTCPIPTKKPDGSMVPDSKRKELAAECNNRREKRFAAQELSGLPSSG